MTVATTPAGEDVPENVGRGVLVDDAISRVLGRAEVAAPELERHLSALVSAPHELAGYVGDHASELLRRSVEFCRRVRDLINDATRPARDTPEEHAG